MEEDHQDSQEEYIYTRYLEEEISLEDLTEEEESYDDDDDDDYSLYHNYLIQETDTEYILAESMKMMHEQQQFCHVELKVNGK